MSRLRLLPGNTTPPDWFRKTFREDGHTVRALDYDSWIAAINKHVRDNGYDPAAHTPEICEHELCMLLPSGWCRWDDGSEPTRFINTRFTIGDFIHGTEVLGSFITSGDPVVSQELAESRAKTCASCYANINIPGCSPCMAIANRVAAFTGGKTTQSDQHLAACAVCHCSNQAQVWIPAKHLAKGVTPDMMELYQQIPWCWKGAELRALEG